MQQVKIFCKACVSEIGVISNKKPLFGNMKQLSKVEIDGSKINIKCHSCSNWQTFENGTQETNQKRKAQEHLNIN